MDQNIEKLNEKIKLAYLGGGEERIAKQHAKKTLTARERIEYLLDEGSFEIIYSFPSYLLAICMIFLTLLSHATTLSLIKITQSPRFGVHFLLALII